MGRDFTLDIYHKLCISVMNAGFQIHRVNDYLSSSVKEEGKKIIMRHDVDLKPERALEMAKLEKSLGFNSTYYFRYINGVFNEEIIKEISSMGHEIGYHYEVLAKCNGKMTEAIDKFKFELSKFRQIVHIDTICMHGSPLSKWNDLDLWDNYNFEDYEIQGEAFLSINYDKVHYFTDTGRSWNGAAYNVRDKVQSKKSKILVKSTSELIYALNSINSDVSINTHPQRWHNGFFGWTFELLSQNIKNIGKRYLLRKHG